MTINYWFQLYHRSLRARFSMATLERHQDRLLAAMYARYEAIRTLPMTKTQFRDALERLGLTQGQAAARLGRTIRMVNAYANGQPIPLVVASLVESWLKHGLPKN